jgi:hypothetical protein
MKGIEGLLETAKAVVEATENKEAGLVALLVPTLKKEVQDFEKEHFPGGLTAVGHKLGEFAPTRTFRGHGGRRKRLEIEGS